ncbi:DUF4179 domain-containing protein [Cohnella lubricantis]|uniref:DUF4179 domain-containing protein n=1 Tax=Cohnella lubricantis TaxID=2163172 RepID=A0A841TGE5_9BACL|nr:DUF4179 domain-containing protein [Cohnella lubricantis]MBB6679436.1 DUF4179 domain-containing protein [Cohnella lubricantis]MBP2118172.1 hypothetical protein [Cohnella lubricantis]
MNYREAEVEALLRGAAVRHTGAVPAVPAVVADRIDEVLEGLPERTKPERAPRWRPLMGFAAAGLAIAVVAVFAGQRDWSGMLPQSPSHSAVIGVVGEIMPEADSMTGPSVTDQGITVMVREVVYDDSYVGLRYTVSSDRQIDLSKVDAELQLNEQWAGYIGSIPEGKITGPLYDRSQRMEDGTYEGVVITPSQTALAPQELSPILMKVIPHSVQLNINKIGDVAGDWSFDMPVQSGKWRTVAGSVSRTNANGTFHLNKVMASPVSTQLWYGHTLSGFGESDNLGVEITDDTGQINEEVLSTRNPLDFDNEKINLPPLPKDAKSLRIRPFVFNLAQFEAKPVSFRTEMKEPPTESRPLKLPLRDTDTVDVTSIDYLPDRTIIHMQPVDYIWSLQLLDGEGNPIHSLAWNNGTDAVFEPVAPDTKLVFVTFGRTAKKYIPELEINVDLPHGK